MAELGPGGVHVAVEIETKALERALARYVAALPDAAARAVAIVAFGIERGAKERCAVDTGRLRASIHTVLQMGTHRDGRPSGSTYSDREGHSFDGTLPESPAAIGSGIVEALVGTNVDYADVIEAKGGRATQPGMFRAAIAEQRGKLEDALGDELDKAAQRAARG